jgi:uncharacterized membrane protein YecN with MAPEG domain
MVVITPLFAAIFGLMFMALSINVVRYRLGSKISLGSKDNKDLEIAMRTHGNFLEYVPFALLLMWFIETLTLSANLVFWLGSILLIARALHALGMFYPRQLMTLRKIGVILTFGVILRACFSILQHYMPLTI